MFSYSENSLTVNKTVFFLTDIKLFQTFSFKHNHHHIIVKCKRNIASCSVQ
jgi:hypothetical protein